MQYLTIVNQAYRVHSVANQNRLPICPLNWGTSKVDVPIGRCRERIESPFNCGMEVFVFLGEFTP
jgi:hypothetical protein